jgi:hypothetical protein
VYCNWFKIKKTFSSWWGNIKKKQIKNKKNGSRQKVFCRY